jgi:hypothetical protein
MLERAVPGFVIRGNADELSARLKSELEARDARFKASLEALFKPAPPSPEPAPPCDQPVSAAQAPSSGGSHETSRGPLSRTGDRMVQGSRLR